MMKKNGVEGYKNVPLYGFHETKDVEQVNELIASGEWMERQITPDGKYILKRFRK